MNNLVIWMDGKRTPLNGKRLKLYIMSMREVVETYHRNNRFTLKIAVITIIYARLKYCEH